MKGKKRKSKRHVKKEERRKSDRPFLQLLGSDLVFKQKTDMINLITLLQVFTINGGLKARFLLFFI